MRAFFYRGIELDLKAERIGELKRAALERLIHECVGAPGFRQEGGCLVEIAFVADVEAQAIAGGGRRLAQHERVMLVLLAAAQVDRFVVAILDMQADGVFVELAAGIEVRDIEHGVAAPDDVERWIEDVRWCRHVASLVKLVVDYSVIASEATQSIFLGSRGWIASSPVLLAMTEMSDAFCSHDESGPSL